MRIETVTNDVQSTMMGEKVALGLSNEAGDLAHILSVLTDLYKDRLLAVIREYSTNALDAHVEGGFCGPIDVTLPSAFAPFLKVRDYGCGLDAEDIRVVYSQYGRSTKRGSNDQVGMLGLGCKSALTYTDQFTVTSVKDGRRVTVLVARDEEGAGHMQILGDVETDESNGTEVTVAIRREDHDRCAKLAAEFYSYWAEGTVNVNGKPPVSFKSKALRITDDLYIIDGPSGQDRVVMGNVAYPHSIDHGVKQGYNCNFSVVAFVPIGSVKPTPAREALMDTALTKRTLAALTESFRTGVKGAIQREVDKAATHADALRVISSWERYVPQGGQRDYTYKGARVPAGFTPPPVPGVTLGASVEYTAFRDYGRKSQVYHAGAWASDKWPTTVWVENFEPATFTAQHKNKLMKWCRDNDIGYNAQGHGDGTVEYFVLLEGTAPVSPFIDKTMVVPWTTVRAIKLDPKPRPAWKGAARVSGSFDVWTEDGNGGVKEAKEVLGDDIRTDCPIFWAHGNLWATNPQAQALAVIHPKFTLVSLPQNRIAKFCREVPAAKPAGDAVKDCFTQWEGSLTVDELTSLGLYNNYRAASRIAKLDDARVDDPALARAIRLSKTNKSHKLRATHRLFRSLLPVSVTNPLEDRLNKMGDPLHGYMLLNGYVDIKSHDHTYLYLNAAYAATKKGAKP